MTAPRDNWDGYFADKLWRLMPAIHRTLDTDQYDAAGPLREIVDRIGASAADIRRAFDRLWEDQSIETCDPWVIPYIADLVGTRLVEGLDTEGQRRDVANTIGYRRRKGTLAVVEQVASDISGWDVKVVEFFRRLARTRHGLDPALGHAGVQPQAGFAIAEGLIGEATATPIGGFANLRDVAGAQLTGTAFDEFFHTADLRAGRGRCGWYAIPRLGIFVWRLAAYDVGGVTPVPVSGCPGWYCFDPTGRDIALFARDRSRAVTVDDWVSPGPADIAAPISRVLLEASMLAPVVAGNGQTGTTLTTHGWGDRISDLPNIGDLFTIAGVEAADPETGAPTGTLQQFAIAATVTPGRDGAAALTVSPAIATGKGGSVAAVPADGARLIFAARADASLYGDGAGAAIAVRTTALVPPDAILLRPERGRFHLAGATALPTGDYAYGFSSDIGAGPYDRRGQETPVATPAPVASISGGGIPIGGQCDAGTIIIADSATYGAEPVSVGGDLTICAANETRPLIRLAAGQKWVIRGTSPAASLTLDGLFVSGGNIILTGRFAAVTITCSTFDPGATAVTESSPPGARFATSADSRVLRPTRLTIEAAVANLIVDRSLLGPVRARDFDPARDPDEAAPTAEAPGKGVVETATVSNSVIQALRPPPDRPLALQPLSLSDIADPVRFRARLADPADAATQRLVAMEAALAYPASPPQSPPDSPPASPPASPLLALQAIVDRLNRLGSLPGVDRGTLEQLFPLEIGASAFAFADGVLNLSRCSLLGRVNAHRLAASECLLTDTTIVDDQQDGCVRFSAVTEDGRLPRTYECTAIAAAAPLFVSTRFGDAAYAQLREDADGQCLPPSSQLASQQTTILAGAADGSEMGAFAREKSPIRARALRVKLEEYMPAGLTPVLINVT